MAKVVLDFGAEIDVLTQDELDKSLGRAARAMYERARGVTWPRQINRAGGNPVLLNGPKMGFIWDLKVVSMQVSAAATVTLYAGEAQKNVLALPQTLTAAGPAVFTFGSHQAPIYGGELIAVSATAGTLTDLMTVAVQAPQEMAGKLIS